MKLLVHFLVYLHIYGNFFHVFNANGLSNKNDHTTDISCSNPCSGSSNLIQNSIGNSVKYKFTINTFGKFEDVDDHYSSFDIEGTLKLTSLTQCSYEMRLSDLNLSHETKANDYSTKDGFEELSKKLLEYPIIFNYDDGKVNGICPHLKEDTYSRNVKSGIISQFQISANHKSGSMHIEETDISGTCITQYTILSNSQNTQVDVEKIKSSAGCSNKFNNMANNFMDLVEIPSELSKLTAFDADHRCSLRIEAKAMKEITCTESFHLLNDINNKRILYTTSFKLNFTSFESKPISAQSFNALTIRESLNFRRFPTEFNTGSVQISLYDQIVAFSTIPVEQRSQEFFKLLDQVRRSRDIEKTGDLIYAKGDQSLKYIFWDLLTDAKTSESISYLLDKTNLQMILKENYILNFSTLKNVTMQVVREATNLIAMENWNGKRILLGHIAGLYCAEDKKCLKNCPEILEIAAYIEKPIRDDCTFNSQEETLESLKGLGNLGLVSDTNVYLEKMEACLGSENHQISLYAAESFRRFRCFNAKVENLLMKTIKNKILIDPSTRIAAYQSLYNCINSKKFNELLTFFKENPDDQMTSFAVSHIKSVLKNIDSENQRYRKIIQENAESFFSIANDMKKDLILGSMYKHFDLNYGQRKLIIDACVVFGTKSVVPSRVNLKVSLELGSLRTNLFEVEMDSERNLLIEELFQIFRNKFIHQNESNQLEDKLKENFYTNVGVSIRYAGYENYYTNNFKVNDILLLMKGIMNRHFMNVDMDLQFPTILGIPLNYKIQSLLSFSNHMKVFRVGLGITRSLELHNIGLKFDTQFGSEIPYDYSYDWELDLRRFQIKPTNGPISIINRISSTQLRLNDGKDFKIHDDHYGMKFDNFKGIEFLFEKSNNKDGSLRKYRIHFKNLLDESDSEMFVISFKRELTDDNHQDVEFQVKLEKLTHYLVQAKIDSNNKLTGYTKINSYEADLFGRITPPSGIITQTNFDLVMNGRSPPDVVNIKGSTDLKKTFKIDIERVSEGPKRKLGFWLIQKMITRHIRYSGGKNFYLNLDLHWGDLVSLGKIDAKSFYGDGRRSEAVIEHEWKNKYKSGKFKALFEQESGRMYNNMVEKLSGNGHSISYDSLRKTGDDEYKSSMGMRYFTSDRDADHNRSQSEFRVYSEDPKNKNMDFDFNLMFFKQAHLNKTTDFGINHLIRHKAFNVERTSNCTGKTYGQVLIEKIEGHCKTLETNRINEMFFTMDRDLQMIKSRLNFTSGASEIVSLSNDFNMGETKLDSYLTLYNKTVYHLSSKFSDRSQKSSLDLHVASKLYQNSAALFDISSTISRDNTSLHVISNVTSYKSETHSVELKLAGLYSIYSPKNQLKLIYINQNSKPFGFNIMNKKVYETNNATSSIYFKESSTKFLFYNNESIYGFSVEFLRPLFIAKKIFLGHQFPIGIEFGKRFNHNINISDYIFELSWPKLFQFISKTTPIHHENELQLSLFTSLNIINHGQGFIKKSTTIYHNPLKKIGISGYGEYSMVNIETSDQLFSYEVSNQRRNDKMNDFIMKYQSQDMGRYTNVELFDLNAILNYEQGAYFNAKVYNSFRYYNGRGMNIFEGNLTVARGEQYPFVDIRVETLDSKGAFIFHENECGNCFESNLKWNAKQYLVASFNSTNDLLFHVDIPEYKTNLFVLANFRDLSKITHVILKVEFNTDIKNSHVCQIKYDANLRRDRLSMILLNDLVINSDTASECRGKVKLVGKLNYNSDPFNNTIHLSYSKNDAQVFLINYQSVNEKIHLAFDLIKVLRGELNATIMTRSILAGIIEYGDKNVIIHVDEVKFSSDELWMQIRTNIRHYENLTLYVKKEISFWEKKISLYANTTINQVPAYLNTTIGTYSHTWFSFGQPSYGDYLFGIDVPIQEFSANNMILRFQNHDRSNFLLDIDTQKEEKRVIFNYTSSSHKIYSSFKSSEPSTEYQVTSEAEFRVGHEQVFPFVDMLMSGSGVNPDGILLDDKNSVQSKHEAMNGRRYKTSLSKNTSEIEVVDFPMGLLKIKATHVKNNGSGLMLSMDNVFYFNLNFVTTLKTYYESVIKHQFIFKTKDQTIWDQKVSVAFGPGTKIINGSIYNEYTKGIALFINYTSMGFSQNIIVKSKFENQTPPIFGFQFKDLTISAFMEMYEKVMKLEINDRGDALLGATMSAKMQPLNAGLNLFYRLSRKDKLENIIMIAKFESLHDPHIVQLKAVDFDFKFEFDSSKKHVLLAHLKDSFRYDIKTNFLSLFKHVFIQKRDWIRELSEEEAYNFDLGENSIILRKNEMDPDSVMITFTPAADTALNFASLIFKMCHNHTDAYYKMNFEQDSVGLGSKIDIEVAFDPYRRVLAGFGLNQEVFPFTKIHMNSVERILEVSHQPHEISFKLENSPVGRYQNSMDSSKDFNISIDPDLFELKYDSSYRKSLISLLTKRHSYSVCWDTESDGCIQLNVSKETIFLKTPLREVRLILEEKRDIIKFLDKSNNDEEDLLVMLHLNESMIEVESNLLKEKICLYHSMDEISSHMSIDMKSCDLDNLRKKKTINLYHSFKKNSMELLLNVDRHNYGINIQELSKNEFYKATTFFGDKKIEWTSISTREYTTLSNDENFNFTSKLIRLENGVVLKYFNLDWKDTIFFKIKSVISQYPPKIHMTVHTKSDFAQVYVRQTDPSTVKGYVMNGKDGVIKTDAILLVDKNEQNEFSFETRYNDQLILVPVRNIDPDYIVSKLSDLTRDFKTKTSEISLNLLQPFFLIAKTQKALALLKKLESQFKVAKTTLSDWERNNEFFAQDISRLINFSFFSDRFLIQDKNLIEAIKNAFSTERKSLKEEIGNGIKGIKQFIIESLSRLSFKSFHSAFTSLLTYTNRLLLKSTKVVFPKLEGTIAKSQFAIVNHFGDFINGSITTLKEDEEFTKIILLVEENLEKVKNRTKEFIVNQGVSAKVVHTLFDGSLSDAVEEHFKWHLARGHSFTAEDGKTVLTNHWYIPPLYNTFHNALLSGLSKKFIELYSMANMDKGANEIKHDLASFLRFDAFPRLPDDKFTTSWLVSSKVIHSFDGQWIPTCATCVFVLLEDRDYKSIKITGQKIGTYLMIEIYGDVIEAFNGKFTLNREKINLPVRKENYGSILSLVDTSYHEKSIFIEFKGTNNKITISIFPELVEVTVNMAMFGQLYGKTGTNNMMGWDDSIDWNSNNHSIMNPVFDGNLIRGYKRIMRKFDFLRNFNYILLPDPLDTDHLIGIAIQLKSCIRKRLMEIESFILKLSKKDKTKFVVVIFDGKDMEKEILLRNPRYQPHLEPEETLTRVREILQNDLFIHDLGAADFSPLYQTRGSAKAVNFLSMTARSNAIALFSCTRCGIIDRLSPIFETRFHYFVDSEIEEHPSVIGSSNGNVILKIDANGKITQTVRHYFEFHKDSCYPATRNPMSAFWLMKNIKENRVKLDSVMTKVADMITMS